MKAGQSNLNVGTNIIIKSTDKDLNGLSGTVTHPFAFGETKKGWVGIYLDTNSIYGEKVNVRETECKLS